MNIGNDGFDSGGGVANTMLMTKGSGTLNTIPIGYLGLNDAITIKALNSDGVSAPSGGSQQYLTLNGVAYSAAAIENGSYDFWGHEHLLTGTTTSAIGATVASELVSQIPVQTTGGILGIPYITSGANQTMFVDRTGGADTGFVTPL